MTPNMTTKWYYYKLGKTRGPFSFSNIKLQIKTNQISKDDFIYKSDLNKWVKVKELDELQKLEPLQNISELNKLFVVLKHDTHKQLGPFDMNTIVEKIHSGDIEFCDYIWKKGMKSWKQIASFIKPISKKHNIEEQKKEDLGNLSKEELLTSVIKLYELSENLDDVSGIDMAKQFGTIEKTPETFTVNNNIDTIEQKIEPDNIRLLDDENTIITINEDRSSITYFFKNIFLHLSKFSKRYLIFILLLSYTVISKIDFQIIKHETFKIEES